MRLFWKMFCSMVIITALACSIGGYVLIDSQFRASLDREVSSLYEENDLLQYTLARELEDQVISNQQDLVHLIEDINITTGRGTLLFRISDQAGVLVAGSAAIPLEASPLIEGLLEGQRGWELRQAPGERTYLHAASPLTFDGKTLYLENCREVTDLFEYRQEQYSDFIFLMVTLVTVVGLLSLAVTSVMLRPLARLSAATKRMAGGDLEYRVRVDRDDELGRLSGDFNTMAAQLEAQVQELKDAAQRQDDFIGSFAHEIKTPLTSIIGYADLMRSRPSTPEQVRMSAGYIFNEGRRLEHLSQKLMDLIVLEKQDFPLRNISMDAFLNRMGNTLRPVFEQRGISLRVRTEDAIVPLEPDLMETVCLNLLDNARKAIDGRGVIVLEGFVYDSGYCIRVTDNGKGIPAQELSRITEAFYMVDKSRARAQGGAGLGLAICQRIVALHNGSMEFQSVPGRGTQVSIYLKGGPGV